MTTTLERHDYFDFFPYATVILQIFCRDFLAAVYIKLQQHLAELQARM